MLAWGLFFAFAALVLAVRFWVLPDIERYREHIVSAMSRGARLAGARRPHRRRLARPAAADHALRRAHPRRPGPRGAGAAVGPQRRRLALAAARRAAAASAHHRRASSPRAPRRRRRAVRRRHQARARRRRRWAGLQRMAPRPERDRGAQRRDRMAGRDARGAAAHAFRPRLAPGELGHVALARPDRASTSRARHDLRGARADRGRRRAARRLEGPRLPAGRLYRPRRMAPLGGLPVQRAPRPGCAARLVERGAGRGERRHRGPRPRGRLGGAWRRALAARARVAARSRAWARVKRRRRAFRQAPGAGHGGRPGDSTNGFPDRVAPASRRHARRQRAGFGGDGPPRRVAAAAAAAQRHAVRPRAARAAGGRAPGMDRSVRCGRRV